MTLFVTGVPENKTWSYFPIGLRNPMNNNSDGFAIAGAMNVQNVGKWRPGPSRLMEAQKMLARGESFGTELTQSQKLAHAVRQFEKGEPVTLPSLPRSQSAPQVGSPQMEAQGDPFRESGRRWRGSRSSSRGFEKFEKPRERSAPRPARRKPGAPKPFKP
jgi:hypothetical protein